MAVEKLFTIPATTPDVGQMLVSYLAKDRELNGMVKRKNESYLSHEVQNELLKLMSNALLRGIANTLQNTNFITVMIDECTNISNTEQVVIVLRWVSDELLANEELIGLYEVSSINASSLVSVVKDTLLRLNLSFNKVRGQCYDGASNMSGAKSGVAKQTLDEQPKAFYTPCYSHSLNLAVADAMKKCSTLKKALNTTHEITKLVKYSPRRESLFKSIKGDITPGSPGIRVLYPTRWTVRADSMQSIIQNYSILQELWEKAVEILILGETLLRNTDNLSRTLQKKEFSAVEDQLVATMTKKTLFALRNEEKFDLFWAKLEILSNNTPADIKDISGVKTYLQNLSTFEKELLSEVIVLMKLILVMPATNSTSERSFSAMRRIKTYLKSTMTQEQLNSLIVLHAHNDLTDNLSLTDIANDFVSKSERRYQVFGQF
ncbi:PREDICTED: zinc finger MYM-type protein 1-like [Amphimedon queenslandica]|uniref:DUF4371 domain-containing protein n=1 Tax=Amphimedon queenslandica TaxID=400682 RepID=A0AAN0IKW2_AMPQE|nr:PREDICTED: zinc finger MYM-type protein 1-like [Amphimedon queenslandica]|eukprot:XP_011403413.1 PREDICTED: zinc finger MYM-type protein 1-like [Amphimedon queenslandica]